MANSILNNIESTGQNVRKVYQRRLPSDPTRDYYYILRNTDDLESLIVEYGFIDNSSDVEFLKENYKELAEATIKSVLEYKNIPYKEPDTIITDTYEVVSGDTLYGIAKKLDTSVDELKKINNLTTNILNVGQVLKVPTKLVYIDGTKLYQVKKGDTLYSIAKAYNTDVDTLKSLNNLSQDSLIIGQLLNVPSGLSDMNTYTVASGDTLYSIAKKFDISVDEIKQINNLSSNMLSIGQKLIIPKDVETTYVVKSGDTLYGIAKKFNLSVDELKKLNNLNSNMLSLGQILIVKNI